MNERLWEIYEQLCLVEMVPLAEFVSRVKDGEFGEFATEDVVELLREIESNMLQNIQAKTMEHQSYAEMADQVAEDTQKMIEELIDAVRRA